MLPDALANLRHQGALDCAQGQKAEAEFPFCPRSVDRAVMNIATVCVAVTAPGAAAESARARCASRNDHRSDGTVTRKA